MLGSSSRGCLKRIHSQLCTPSSTGLSTNTHARCSRYASSIPDLSRHKTNTSPNFNKNKNPLLSGIRPLEFPADVSHQKTLSRTTQARATMQMMAEAERGKYHECLAIAAQMKRDGIRPELSTYTALLQAAASDASWLDAWSILDDMILVGIKPTINTFNHLIQAQRQRSSQYVWEVMKKMNELGVAPNSTTFTHIIQRFAVDKNLEMVLQYFYAMKSHGIVPEIKAAQIVVNLAADRGYPRLAIDIAAWFEESSVRRLDHAAWMNCLISSADNLYVDGVIYCWKMVVQELKITPDEGLCLSVLHTAARHGLPDLCTDALRVLKLMGSPWKEHHFAPLIESFCRSKQVKEAMLTLDIMRKNGVEPSSETAYPILDTMKHDTDAVDAAWAIIDELHQDGQNIDATAFQVLIHASVILGDLQRAVGAYKSLPDYGISPDLTIFNLLLWGCISARHRELGNLLLADMQAAKIKPNQETYERFIALCLTQDYYEDAFFYLEEMKSAGHTPLQGTYEGLISKCLSADDTRYKIAIEEMEEAGYKLSRELDNQIYQAIRRQRKDTKNSVQLERDQPSGLDGAAQQFIETGGLVGVAKIGQSPGDSNERGSGVQQ